MKNLILALVVVFTSTGCAITRWNKISTGQSRAEVIESMGEADDVGQEQGKEVLAWSMPGFHICGVMLSSDGHVIGKSCKVDVEAGNQALQSQSQNQSASYQ